MTSDTTTTTTTTNTPHPSNGITPAILNPTLHMLLLLSDSALPLGSFAFSSGLESWLAHQKNRPNLLPSHNPKTAAFHSFLEQSIHNTSSTTLPYVLTAHAHPERLPDLDNDLDASTPCTVARRASISQGRALLGVWERALHYPASSRDDDSARLAIGAYAARMREGNGADGFGMQLQAHFAPLFGSVGAALGLSARETAYVFLLNHAKAVLSAAVRASVLGPYQSQAVLASGELQDWMRDCIAEQEVMEGRNAAEEAAVVTVPTMDLWMGRHELLYSRIFNS